MLRAVTVLLFASSATWACSCREITVKEASDHADVVFRGTIVSFRDSAKDFGIPGVFKGTKKLAVFHVTRVWKGDVGQTFEMPAVEELAACTGFWSKFLKEDTELLVYANRARRDSEYYTSICTRTALASKSKDYEELGSGKEPAVK
jgi:hypothetical protein